MFYPLGFLHSKEQEDPIVFKKDAYNALVIKNRKEYVHKYFLDILKPLFEELKKDAAEMKQCHREVVFELPQNFSLTKTETVLCAYFIDIGYKPLIEASTVSVNPEKELIKITITIT